MADCQLAVAPAGDIFIHLIKMIRADRRSDLIVGTPALAMQNS